MIVFPRPTIAFVALFAALSWMASNPLRSATAANANVSIGVTVASATSISTASCATGAAGVTDFGQVLPSTNAMTSADCVIQFGSSNNTSALRIRQTDTTGRAMFAYSNGELDQAFDGDSGTANGKVHLPYGGFVGFGEGVASALSSGGEILMAGSTGAPADATVLRLRSNGTVDTAFDGPSGTGNGAVTFDVYGATDTYVGGLVALGDGNYILSIDPSGVTPSMSFIKFNELGQLDPNFDGPSGVGNGIVTLNVPAADVTLGEITRSASSGAVFAVGTADSDLMVVKIDPSTGLPDASFDGPSGVGNGIVIHDFGGFDNGTQISIRGDHRIVAMGYTRVTQLTSSGELDATFDGPSGTANGSFVLPLLGQQRDMVLADDGRLYVLGQGGANAMYFARLMPDGSFDTTFDGPLGTGNGEFLTKPFSGFNVPITGVVQADHKVFFGGYGETVSHPNPAFSGRLTSTGAFDPSYASGSPHIGIQPYTGAPDIAFISSITVLEEGRAFGIGTNQTDGLFVVKHASSTVPDYNGTTASWSNSMFGACLNAVTNATSVWTLGGSCTAANGASWNDVPSAAENLATAASGVTNATAQIRFGFRPAATQQPGSYYAPVTFEVVAPG